MLDTGGRILVASRMFAEAVGVIGDELEGCALDGCGMAPVLAERFQGHVRRCASTGHPASVSGLLPGRTLRFAPVLDPDGRVWAVTVGARVGAEALDAARREAEEARAEAARERAAKGKFLAAASHDLRQPFQAMHLFHHLLSAKLTDSGALDMAARLGESIEAAEVLLRALLDVTKLDAGLITAELGPVPVDDVLGRLIDEFQPEADKAGLRFSVHPTGCDVVSDAALLERLLRPLIANALRFTEKGGVLIGGRHRGGSLRLEVWDTGCGIPESERDAIWNDFHQLGNPARDRRHGLGLGLAIAQRLAALLGATLSVRSRPGHGSVFAVELPLAGVARGPAPQHQPAEEEPPAQGTVLVVEDDPMQLEGIVMLLRDWGYRALPTRGLAEACREAATRLPDIIVSDLRLSGPETGVDVIRTLWSRLGLRIPGVIVTGDTDPERLRLVNAAEFRLVHKPFDPAVLRAIIARSLAALPPAMEAAAAGAA
ncbi:response regulator [Azospirillum sp. ROY-1-1-2]|uniref:histidine kinase n=1 Tax=Azospirillum oleiclasticum TaxID=2735135 RepID=A0ABX2TAG5_9PROT|nr:ATP-binding protein [Azospirillum oleiclasticum]NYZ21329.1 response regulator [Azospirillum oleiclasticum]